MLNVVNMVVCAFIICKNLYSFTEKGKHTENMQVNPVGNKTSLKSELHKEKINLVKDGG